MLHSLQLSSKWLSLCYIYRWHILRIMTSGVCQGYVLSCLVILGNCGLRNVGSGEEWRIGLLEVSWLGVGLLRVIWLRDGLLYVGLLRGGLWQDGLLRADWWGNGWLWV